jgi:hypothetical protein
VAEGRRRRAADLSIAGLRNLYPLVGMRAERLPPLGMFIIPHGAPEGYEWFVALVVLVGLYFAVRNFMRERR